MAVALFLSALDVILQQGIAAYFSEFGYIHKLFFSFMTAHERETFACMPSEAWVERDY